MNKEKMVEMLDHNIEDARVKVLPNLSIASEEYGLVMDNIVKTINVINALVGNRDGGQEKDRGQRLLEERIEVYKKQFVGKGLEDFEFDVTSTKDFIILVSSEKCPHCVKLREELVPKLEEKGVETVNFEFDDKREYFMDLEIKDTPFMLLVNKDGIIKHVEVGYLGSKPDYVDHLLEKF